MPEPLIEPIKQLVGLELASVTFVRDYVQLGFDGPVLDALTPIAVATNGETVTSGHRDFRNRLCDLIGSQVTEVALHEDEAFRLDFTDSRWIALSLRPEDYPGPEAIVLHGAGAVTVVF